MTKLVFGLAIILWIVFFYFKSKYQQACSVNSINRAFNVENLENLKAAVNNAKRANQMAFMATFVTVFGIILSIL